MKQNITIAIDKHLLERVRALAGERQSTISAILASVLKKIVMDVAEFESARVKALAQLNSPFRLGGGKRASRESLHRRN